MPLTVELVTARDTVTVSENALVVTVSPYKKATPSRLCSDYLSLNYDEGEVIDKVGKKCSPTHIYTLLETIQNQKPTVLYLECESITSSIVSLEIGCLVATGEDIHSALYKAASRPIKPNYYILCVFDYLLSMEGVLLQAVDDWRATGIIVNSLGQVLESVW